MTTVSKLGNKVIDELETREITMEELTEKGFDYDGTKNH